MKLLIPTILAVVIYSGGCFSDAVADARKNSKPVEAPTQVEEGKSLGIWTTSDKNYTYAFLKDNEFRFTTPDISTPYSYKVNIAEGVWRAADNVCWSGEEKSRQYGNLLIYVDSMQCCMGAQLLGKRLVLGEIWQKEYQEHPICKNRTLVPVDPPPTQ